MNILKLNIMKRFATLILLLTTLFAVNVNAQKVQQIKSTDVQKLISSNKNIVILDVRTPEEFSAGHIKNAVNIDVSKPDAFEKYANLDKQTQYIVYCRTKNRSGVVTNFLVNNGFTNILQMTDGIVGWNSNNLPLSK